MSRSEEILQALFALISGAVPVGALALRNAALPTRIPAAGVVILRDGTPGDPEFLFSPATWLYDHAAEVEVIVEAATAAERDAAFDAIKTGIGEALAADRTLGGLCDFALPEAPEPVDLPVEGAEGLKAAVIDVILSYSTTDPLA